MKGGSDLKNDIYQPKDNYERNFLLVKKFGGKFGVLFLTILFFANIVLSIILSFQENDKLIVIITRVASSKFSFNIDLGEYKTLLFLGNVLISAFITCCLILIFVKSRNMGFSESPEMGILLLHKFSMLEIVFCAVVFLAMIAETGYFMFGDINNFDWLAHIFNMNISDILAYKVTFVIFFILADILSFMLIWNAQSQAVFLKSIKQTLLESVPRNKGAHAYGVFSLSIGILLIGYAALVTFLYTCYKDAFSGFSIDVDKTFVILSLSLAYIRGLIPCVIGILAFSFSSMVDESNNYNNLSYNFQVLGDAQDPNMSGRKNNFY